MISVLSRAVGQLGHTGEAGSLGISYLHPLDFAVGEDGDVGFRLGSQHGGCMHHQQKGHGLAGQHPGAGRKQGAPVTNVGYRDRLLRWRQEPSALVHGPPGAV